MNISNRIKTLLTILGVCLLVAACNFLSRETADTEATRPRSETVSEVKNRFREPYMQLRMRFAEIARALPPAGSVRNRGAGGGRGQMANLNPLPTSENAGFAAAEQLLDPGRVPSFHLGMANCPVQCFRWLASDTASNLNLPETEDRNGEMARGFEAGLAHRYLVVYRATRYVHPQVTVPEDSSGAGLIGSLRYTPGAVDLEALIVDLQSNAVVDSFRVSGATPNEVRFTTFSNLNAQDTERQMLAEVESKLRENTRENVFAGLTERTGRTFNPPSNSSSN